MTFVSTSLLLAFVLVLLNAQGFHAFPTGCPLSRPAVGAPHLTATNVVNGTLSDGSLVLFLDDDRFDDPDRTIFVQANQTASLVVRAPFGGAGMTGFLIRLGHSSSSSTSAMDLTNALSPTPDRTTAAASAKVEETFCRDQKAAGLTQVTADPKYLVKGDLFLEEPLKDLVLDITVVVKNSEDQSEFYYSQYRVEAVEKKEPAPPPQDDGETNYITLGDSAASTMPLVAGSLTGLLLLGGWI